MPDPEPVDGASVLRSVSAQLTARYPDPPTVAASETTAEVAERHARLVDTMLGRWRVPPKFADATLAGLSADEDPDGKVSGWLDSDARNLVLWSTTTGNGKSHAAHAIGNRAVRRGLWCATWALTRLNQAFRPGGDEAAYDVVTACDLLVLDDVGGESVTPWTFDRLLDVLDARTGRTIYTTNLTGAETIERYGRRIAERMIDKAWIVEFTGPTWREPAPW